MNVWVLNNRLVRFHCNEQKAIARARRCAFLEWDRLQSDLQYTPKVPKPTLVKLTSSHILWLFNMTTWGVGAIPLNVQAKLECDEDLAFVIRITQTKYAKVFKALRWNTIGSLHRIKRSYIRKLTSLHNTLIQKWFMVNKFLIMP